MESYEDSDNSDLNNIESLHFTEDFPVVISSFNDVVSIHTNTKEFKDIKINLYEFKDDADQHAASEAIIIDVNKLTYKKSIDEIEKYILNEFSSNIDSNLSYSHIFERNEDLNLTNYKQYQEAENII